MAPCLTRAWPGNTAFEKRCFRRLVGAYTAARYAENFGFSQEEFAWIDARIGALQTLVSVEFALQCLGEPCKTAFDKRRNEHLRYDEIAALMDLQVAEVETLIAKALDAIVRLAK